MIKQYSLKKQGKDYKLSEHFKLKEFACPDGTDTVIVSEELIDMLEKLRAYGGFTITVNSGYRTAAYNKKIGGATGSKHTLGQAADIRVYKGKNLIDVRLVSCLCQTLGFNGIGAMNTAVHVDVASRIYRGDEKHGYGNNIGGDFYSYFKVKKSQIDALRVSAEPEKPEAGYDVRVTATSLYIRKGAGTIYDAAGFLKKNQIVRIVGLAGNDSGSYWGQLGNGKGWISLKYTEVVR